MLYNMKISFFSIFIILIYPDQLFTDASTCYKQPVNSTRQLYVQFDDPLNIAIGVSDRISNQLISHIFKYILEEIIGYSGVEIVKFDDNVTKILDSISNYKNSRNFVGRYNSRSEIMIYLELWIHPSFNLEPWINSQEVVDAGATGYFGRSGWFIPNYVIDEGKKNNIIYDHWMSFRNKNISAEFSISREDLQNYIFDKSSESYFCLDENCEKGMYVPAQCNGSEKVCATLLADYPENSLPILKSQIECFDLYVTVAFLGYNLETLFSEQIENKLGSSNDTSDIPKIIVFSRTPNTISSSTNLSLIAFPHCQDSSEYFSIAFSDSKFSTSPCNVMCDYEMYQIEKVSWSAIKTYAPDIYFLLRHLEFSPNQLNNLLKQYTSLKPRGKTIEDVACLWIKENGVRDWIPDYLDQQPIFIGGIFPETGPWQQRSIFPAASLAVQHINDNKTILNGFTLHILNKDGQCTNNVVMKTFIEYITLSNFSQLIGILGPACSNTIDPAAQVAKDFNTIMISYSAEGNVERETNKNNTRQYSTFFRTIPDNSQFHKVFEQLFERLEWKRLFVLSEDDQKHSQYIKPLEKLFREEDIYISVETISGNNITEIQSKLDLLKSKNARIIIGAFQIYTARYVMCEVYHKEMYHDFEYTWFLPRWFSDDWFRFNNNPDEEIRCTPEEMKLAITGHLSLSYKFYADNSTVIESNITVGKWKELYQQEVESQNMTMSNYAGYAYDAVWAYAYAFEELIKENRSYMDKLHHKSTTKKMVEILRNLVFQGVSGPIRFTNSSRFSDIIISQWNDTHHEVGNIARNKSLILSPGNWNKDYTEEEFAACPGLEGFRSFLRSINIDADCPKATLLALLSGFLLFIVLVVIVFVTLKKRYDRKVKQAEVRIRQLGLIENGKIPALDQWEIPRDKIVINRKIGEGAFGTVYGGEAYIAKDWIGVAVKTLKKDSSDEEKLDFLSEAEMMKRFDHKNIVRLIGVCTIGKPVYAIMEFMLYGDLKVYLLARRHMVNDKNITNASEISDKCLTNMALDVACGLSYLADQKYVHRDLACRNCLVNDSRRVKIADFGMCRQMYDSDYYKFTKRGMLPVRWMAPESLNDGLFTTMSDVWSFGVLLYEIITFGSFPYGGLANNQVVDCIKNYNILQIPNGCKAEMRNLLLKCWSREPNDRPSAKEIVEILGTNAELISPCLEMPSASVQLDDCDSIELTISEPSGIQSTMSSAFKRRPGSLDNTAFSLSDSEAFQNHIKKGGPRRSLPAKTHFRVNSKGQYVTLELQNEHDRTKSSIHTSSHLVTPL